VQRSAQARLGSTTQEGLGNLGCHQGLAVATLHRNTKPEI
jgi:hypothetical protein